MIRRSNPERRRSSKSQRGALWCPGFAGSRRRRPSGHAGKAGIMNSQVAPKSARADLVRRIRLKQGGIGLMRHAPAAEGEDGKFIAAGGATRMPQVQPKSARGPVVPGIRGIARAPRTSGTQACGIVRRPGATGPRSVERWWRPADRRNPPTLVWLLRWRRRPDRRWACLPR